MINLSQLTTETRNENTMNLDRMTSVEIAEVMNREDEKVVAAVKHVLPQIAQVIDWCSEALEAGGRIIYMGAGTSGRLGVLDAAECLPTFGVSPDTVIGLIAGGTKAFTAAVEGAEDSTTLGVSDLKAINLRAADVVIGLAASGRTPYVIYGLQYAKTLGCRTAVIVCNQGSEMAQVGDLAIELVVGPEVLTGSTRLKAGTAQKMTLNMISTGSMVKAGKVYQNLMVDVVQTNEKLVLRARKIVSEATGCSQEAAAETLKQAGGNAKLAITAILSGQSIKAAEEYLRRSNGHVRRALDLARENN